MYKDSELIELFREGEDWAFDALIERYAEPVLDWASLLTSSEAQASEVVDQVFITLHRALQSNEEFQQDPLEVILHRTTYELSLKSFFSEPSPLSVLGALPEYEEQLSEEE